MKGIMILKERLHSAVKTASECIVTAELRVHSYLRRVHFCCMADVLNQKSECKLETTAETVPGKEVEIHSCTTKDAVTTISIKLSIICHP
jgi:hypothetical protein